MLLTNTSSHQELLHPSKCGCSPGRALGGRSWRRVYTAFCMLHGLFFPESLLNPVLKTGLHGWTNWTRYIVRRELKYSLENRAVRQPIGQWLAMPAGKKCYREKQRGEIAIFNKAYLIKLVLPMLSVLITRNWDVLYTMLSPNIPCMWLRSSV